MGASSEGILRQPFHLVVQPITRQGLQRRDEARV
jgi:hypothetical protein